MNYTVCFYTQNDREWCLRQTMANCVELNSTDNHNNTDGYIVKCGEGTSSTTPQKQYLLTILNTSAIDETGWWCQLKFMKEGSKVTFLIVEGENSFLFCVIRRILLNSDLSLNTHRSSYSN